MAAMRLEDEALIGAKLFDLSVLELHHQARVERIGAQTPHPVCRNNRFMPS